MTGFSTHGSHSGIVWTQKLRAPVENLELTSRFPRWVPTENKYVMCHCLLIDKWIILFYFIFTLYFVLRWPVIDGMLKFKNCAGAEDIQSVDSEHDMNTTDSWLQPVLWTLQTLKSTDGQWPTEVHTLNATDTAFKWSRQRGEWTNFAFVSSV